MKNKVELKKAFIITIITAIFFIILFNAFYFFQYRTYTNTFNEKINSILAKVLEDYPRTK